MKAMILAAGKGERMMPLTKRTPKPLLKAGGKALIDYQVESLALAGIKEIIINTGKFGEKIENHLGDGLKWNITIDYSHEGEEPMGTGGGVQNAKQQLGSEPFILVNGDIWTDYNYKDLKIPTGQLAHLVLVNNPDHNIEGDFCLHAGKVSLTQGKRLTYSGIGVFRPEFFHNNGSPMNSFVPALSRTIERNRVTGEHFTGRWYDIGTPERLKGLDISIS